ncbi:3-hydroxyisobutyrate dehydrogenase, mitochondrial isoform X1 [Megalopta genalis]|uniref:3-hydroxyisobutyrate dehydrogenase, mitochondrial isoform X1 n=2 Tax=Megalopta genalis TaxID=115081 RepID=UPI00144347A3|nr:3-hydroxyisobutyrate dehydrogenase, mitochondrial isoform X1 [Megalopta genalis]
MMTPPRLRYTSDARHTVSIECRRYLSARYKFATIDKYYSGQCISLLLLDHTKCLFERCCIYHSGFRSWARVVFDENIPGDVDPPHSKRASSVMSLIVYRNTFVALKGARSFSRVGFVGLGNMGGHMARNLLKKGCRLTVYDVNETAMSNLTEAGANRASSPAEVAEETEAVVSMLPSNQHVLDVYSGKHGLLSSAREKTLFIDSSTIDPFVSQTLAANAEKQAARFIDAPVSGGVNAAKDGTLTIMVGGSKENLELAKPLLTKMGARVVHCGDVGMGQAAKICNNMLLGISMIGTAEAFNFGERLGLDAKVLADIVNSSSGRCWSSELYNPVPGILDNVPSSKNYEGGFGATLMAKDLGLAQAAAAKVDATIPLGSIAHQIFRTLISQGFSDKDFSVVYQFLKGRK